MSKQKMANFEVSERDVEMSVPTPLEMVAGHEQRLMADIAEAEGQAQRIVEEARGRAAVHRHEQAERLAQDVARRRSEAAVVRQHIADEIAAASQAHTDQVRRETAPKIPSVRAEIIRLILPPGTEGAAS